MTLPSPDACFASESRRGCAHGCQGGAGVPSRNEAGEVPDPANGPTAWREELAIGFTLAAKSLGQTCLSRILPTF